MIVECPHCYTNVLPSREGQCPACRNNVHDAPKADPSKTSLTVRHGAELPSFCCGCGCPTDRYVKVLRKISHKKAQQDTSLGLFLVLGLLFGWIFWLIAWMRGDFRTRVGDVVVARMPQCKLCGANGAPDPIRVNAEELRMTFVVHRQFKEKVLEKAES